jgi:hypothetical protein
LVELAHFQVEDGALHVTCGKCQQVTRVEPAASLEVRPASVAPPEGPSGPPTPSAAVALRLPEPAPSRPPSQPPRVLLQSSPEASNVVTLRTVTVEAVERARLAADTNPFAVPSGRCPKCLAPREGAACSQCGAHFDLFDEALVAPPEWLSAAWVELLRDWGSPLRHEALQAQARQEDALTPLGRLYRLRLAAEPQDPIAEKGRADVVRLAAAQMSLQGQARGLTGPRGRGVKVALTVAVAVALLGAAGYLVHVLLSAS